MPSKIFQTGLAGLFRRVKDNGESEAASRLMQSGIADLRSGDPSAGRDRSAHRRSAWLYEDLLN